MILSSTPVIDLHGFDSEYASIVVKEFILDNYNLNKNKLLIIHGKGLGVLKKRIHSDLRKNKIVESYKINMFNEGETIVLLKKNVDK